MPYNFKVRAIPGKENAADALSRLLPKPSMDEEKQNTNKTEEYIKLIVHEATPNALSAQEVEEASKDDPELQQVRQQLSNNKWDKSSKTFFPMRDELCSIGYLVLRGTRIVIPKALRSKCIKLAHTGQLGIVGTKQRLKSKVWWPGIDKEVEHFVKSCHGCQLVESALPPEPLQVTELPSGPWQDIGIDFLGPLDSGHYILVVIDYYSRYYDAEITKKTTSQKVIDTLDRLFSMHGLPKTLKNQKRHAKYSGLEVGDKVLVEQQLRSKTDTPFNATPFTLVSKRGNSCTIESNEGVQYKRNSTHVKKFLLPKTGESVSVSDVGDKNGRISKAVSQLIPPPETVSSHERPTSSDLAQSPNVHVVRLQLSVIISLRMRAKN
ncbi:hypothetical protein RRG08_010491 [Elysia crispata]|uniref:Integrase zinc-binding domain-containing protein n=1 Tax=Elysia crispata TaxID=231223 RepID=A0AAE1ANS0_9GAST|nr:hypothetical protein RRG08_010491 [Elysia crispata]